MDIFLLHAVDSGGELEAKLPALETLARTKAEGQVRAVGVSSHGREVLTRLLALPEVDVALVVVDQTGTWMEDASPAEMTQAVRRLHRSGRGVYRMKALGSGEVTDQAAVAEVATWRPARRDPKEPRAMARLLRHRHRVLPAPAVLHPRSGVCCRP